MRRRSALKTNCKFVARSAALLGLLLLGACTTLDSADDLQAAVSGEAPVSFESQRAKDPQAKLGAKQHPKILAAHGGAFKSPAMERLLAPVAGALVSSSGDNARAYDITVLDSPQVNAFALPGGYLYVTRGLLALANDEAEVAAVLAHEIAHVTSNHGIERREQAQANEVAERVVNDVVSNEVAGKLARVRVSNRMASFSQTQELQADAVGIKLLGKAGYDPFASARFLENMERYTSWRSASNNSGDDMSSSHPSTPQRVELARRHARAIGPVGTGKRNGKRYLRGLDGLVYGDTANEGYVRGQRFSHVKLGITFEVPEPFELVNQSTAVLASAPGERALRFDAVASNGRVDPVAYLKSGWVNGLQAASVRPLSIDGQPAAFGRAIAGDWQFAVTVIAKEGRMFRFILAVPKSQPDISALGAQIAGSFRRLTDAQKAALKPLKVRVVETKPGDTVNSLARRMKGVSKPELLFRALNGLSPNERITAGTLVKIISDS
ncbi:M48 family metalloprotease [Pseudahrensia aquimaris]|uniref:M48 family metalloprotease n=1 Tax=Pseudahrensia aquimaris TaxID=744461 RepID=A0ABW3F982_9HYPH